jgi:predicted site-specific integrase-resolvase
MKAALYARVSTLDQEPENQLQELRRYAVAQMPVDAAAERLGVSRSTRKRWRRQVKPLALLS